MWLAEREQEINLMFSTVFYATVSQLVGCDLELGLFSLLYGVYMAIVIVISLCVLYTSVSQTGPRKAPRRDMFLLPPNSLGVGRNQKLGPSGGPQ